MRKISCLIVVALAACAQLAIGQDDGEDRIKKALIGRHLLVKMDLPAVNSGVDFVLDDKGVSYNAAKCDKLLKEYGVAVKGGTQARITDVRISNRGIELDLDGGGMPERDWVVRGLKFVPPEPLTKSDREIELERMAASTTLTPTMANYVHNELEYERVRRATQEARNLESFKRAELMRRQYIDENRAKWGSKVVLVVRTQNNSLKMRDMVKSLAKYVELLPGAKPAS
jgi:hypothetical protein